MRTWKQGSIGKLILKNERVVYTKCLKYPLLKIGEAYSKSDNSIERNIIFAFVDLEILRKIEKLVDENLTSAEKEIGMAFEAEYLPGTSIMKKLNTLEMNVIEKIGANGIMNWDRLNKALIENRIEK